ncbi:LacI family DNA-binding transcriptional regulator [Enterococcus asini]|uniref:LacI family DNA-binding transcriptional regulator n=1 Tax=Enterococcus asini TaxID=57732 RepID=UPI0028900D0C|nr:LacI family DNA-binding transcriptional regulator [Enterococcus asini]MDT2744854.1 LacI family DNA-binding transcriptional regulator [Enterococcus asini]MDT2764840.1 LacI family DNA-binding transcriptional regulator [Enterococcus asini]
MVTIKEISKVSGYSQATISRLFKGDESLSITPETKQKIITTALTMGYDRSKIKTTLYKIVVPFFLSRPQVIQDVYFTKVQNALKDYGKVANMELHFVTERAELFTAARGCAGFIGVGELTREELGTLHQMNLKGVLLELNPCPALFDTVRPDTNSITQDAVERFIAEGFTEIGFIGGRYHNPVTGQDEMDNREKTFREVMSRHGLLQDKYIFTEGLFSIDEGYQLASEMYKTLPVLPEACLIASDTLAIGALQAFSEYGVKLPKDMAIISINNDEIAQYVAPPLTTYDIDVTEMIKTAIYLLTDQLTNPRKITKSVLLGSELIIRKSFIPKDEA